MGMLMEEAKEYVDEKSEENQEKAEKLEEKQEIWRTWDMPKPVKQAYIIS